MGILICQIAKCVRVIAWCVWRDGGSSGSFLSRLGPRFVVKTFAAIALLSVLTEWLPGRIDLLVHAPHFGAILAGLLAGTGMLILVRHGASLGGVGVLALWLQETHGWRAGRVLLVADALILGGAYAFLSPSQWMDSLLAAAAMNLSLAVNHKPGRYVRG